MEIMETHKDCLIFYFMESENVNIFERFYEKDGSHNIPGHPYGLVILGTGADTSCAAV